nr:PREDICTED: aminopeptidase B-like [Paralichthys olivaceus]XP_019933771.1 PREDICTED: aminopeptidase B-like [Paralichthys olivaceus]
MAELHQTPTSLCCCRKSLPVSGARRVGDSARPPVGLGPESPRCPLVDVASASNFRCFQLRHFHLDLRLNFAVKEMSGWLVLDLIPVQPGVHTLVLDSHCSLLIHSIDCKAPGGGQEEPMSLTYRVDPFTDYGSSLNISLPPAAVRQGRIIQITVRYSTTDGPAVRDHDTHTVDLSSVHVLASLRPMSFHNLSTLSTFWPVSVQSLSTFHTRLQCERS